MWVSLSMGTEQVEAHGVEWTGGRSILGGLLNLAGLFLVL